MGATLDSLHALQEIELQLAEIRDKGDAKRRMVRVQKRALEKQDALNAEKEAGLLANQMEIDRIELDVKSKEQTLAKHREGLNRAKTNKEYAAILTALNTEKADNAKQESRQLQLLAEQDRLRADGETTHAERDRIAERLRTMEEKLEAYLKEKQPKMARLESARDGAAADLNPSILDIFRRAAERHSGEAMAEIVLQDAKRDIYACGGCNMRLTLQQAIGVRARDGIEMCGSCGKILYCHGAGAPST